MRLFTTALLLATTAFATPALAQDEATGKEFQGFYVGGSIGLTFNRDNSEETIRFDRNLDGIFGDTVVNTAGVNVFAPSATVSGAGFCGGTVGNSPTRPTAGCDREGKDLEFSGRLGFDIQMGSFVGGIIGEVGTTDQTSSVTAFSTTPASYTITREIDYVANLRLRAGVTVTPTSLVYVSGGVAYAKLNNSFSTTNATNSVTLFGDDESWGTIFGLGFEQKVTPNISIGLEGTTANLEDDEFTARLGAGTAPATNPFLLAGAGGTDFRRSNEKFTLYSVRAVVNFRF